MLWWCEMCVVDVDEELLLQFKFWCLSIVKEQNVFVYVVFIDNILIVIVELLFIDDVVLIVIFGIGVCKLE